MAKTTTHLGLMLAALLVILSCATPVVTAPPPGFVETAIAGTHSVAASLTAQVKVAQAGRSSLTPTATLVASATPLATFTLVNLGESEIVALVDTPCRRGPGSIYDRVFLFRKGQTANLVGRSADGAYWIIRNPNRTQQLCWVERGTVRVNRVIGNLPVMTPPPPPTPTRTPTRTARPPSTFTFTPGPTFTASVTPTGTQAPLIQFDWSFSGLDDCPSPTPPTPPSSWWINVEVGNTGDVNFESVTFTVRDNNTTLVFSYDSNVFTGSNGCSAPDTFNFLEPGFSYIVSSVALDYDPSNPSHNFDISLTLCTEDDQTGDCITKSMNITP